MNWIKPVCFLGWLLLSYIGLLFSNSLILNLFLCVSIALATAGVGFNVFHDAIHGALSRHRNVNRYWSFLSCSLIGASYYIWKHKHNYLHHQFPNIEEWDDDLETRGGL